jgi:hypothetical protein
MARKSSSLPRLISLPDAAKALNVTPERLYKLVKARRVSHVRWPGNSRVGTNIFFRESELDRLLDAMTVQADRRRDVIPPEPPKPRGMTSVQECEYYGVEPDPEFQNFDVGKSPH